MNLLLNYVIQVIIVSGLLYSYYHWVLRNKKFHRYNRYYLLGAALLSILIPLLNIPVYFTEEEAASSIVYSTLTVFAGEAPEEAVVVYANTGDKSGWFTWNHILQMIYILVATLVLLRIIFSLLKIRGIVRRHTVEQIGRIRFMNTDEPGTPYSFFSWLLWNRKIELNSEKGEQIFRHELFHIEQKHSLDILFFELLTVVGWFNPFFHLMKSETKAIHEFLADQFAITENNRWDYAELLLMQVLNTNQQLVHPFFHNQIKRRIAMITSPQKTSHQYLRKLMVLPVTALAVMLFAFSYKSSKNESRSTQNNSIPAKDSKSQPVSDTIGKPELVTKKEVKRLSTGTVILSDSIVYKSAAKPNENSSFKPILIVNGKRIFESSLKDKMIIAGKVISYSQGDKEAIKVYGTAARNGVLVFYNAKIMDAETKEAKPEADKIFDKVEIEASFPGGSEAWRRYLERNLNSMVPQLRKAPAGSYTVIIQFIVELDGTISDIKGLTNHGYGMEGEAIRAIKNGPKWLPAIQNGRLVKAFHRQPITYIVDNGPKKEGAVAPGQGKVLNEVVMVSYTEPTNPTFPGGDSAWKKYLASNANSLVPANNGAPEGQYKTRIQFIVHPDGSISDITALTHFGYGMEDEAIRVIKNSPRWIPATREGTKVSSYKEQSITFIITGEPDRPNYPPIIPSIKLTNITAPRLANGDLINLDPGIIYIGLTNILLLEAPSNELKYITAETGSGNKLFIKNGKLEISTNAIQDNYAIKLFYTKDNIKTAVKTVNFPVRLVPQQ